MYSFFNFERETSPFNLSFHIDPVRWMVSGWLILADADLL
jgi:hypothetical protein